ncbi:MAG: response regulator [Deltaproteobacteria bacterium]|nr:response regulator [Deltaproteobacteria bacterium]MBW1793605.1 response regulator [Deltaproteobacteria bacterium]MBW2329985.1 response regulator [Deltaproteobacteria bacterium]
MDYEPSNILLVEDDEAHAELTERAIRKAGNANRIDVLTDGEDALEYVFNRGKYADKAKYPLPGLILLDIKLPGIDGIEVLTQIKEHPIVKKIPVIMLTTSEREEDICQSYSHYANSYLTKPVGFKEFEEKIMQIDFYWMLLNKPPSLET